MSNRRKILAKRWRELRAIPNVLNIGESTKWTGGVDTFEPCITFYVSKKVSKEALTAEQMIPAEIDGIKTDVVELPADFKLANTKVSKLPFDVQKRLAGGVRRS